MGKAKGLLTSYKFILHICLHSGDYKYDLNVATKPYSLVPRFSWKVKWNLITSIWFIYF